MSILVRWLPCLAPLDDLSFEPRDSVAANTYAGFSNYLWPLLFGARDMAMPRLNALSYRIYLFSGLFIYASFLFGAAPNNGWFNYVPYASTAYNPGPNIDFYALGLIFLGISTTVGAVNFVVTFLRMRAPGMSLDRLPIMAWSTLTVSIANILVIPCVSLAFFLLVDGPKRRDALLRCGRRRPTAAVAAPLLDVRPPVGLPGPGSPSPLRRRRFSDVRSADGAPRP